MRARVTSRRAVGRAHASRRLGRSRVSTLGWPGGVGLGQERGRVAWPLARLRSPSNRRRKGCCQKPRQLRSPVVGRLGEKQFRKPRGPCSCADSSVAGPKGSFILFIASFFSLLVSPRQDVSLSPKRERKGEKPLLRKKLGPRSTKESGTTSQEPGQHCGPFCPERPAY
ncbi:uncharacterized protein LOC121100782 isoform X2 [Ursus maritimus]|uniref:Uncharacterized protein LOC121100782 isoform X2 n=1 Tax=Ursus maritimus TaxID=29073 RepID=A0A8M1F9P7_URSMA|nr:uncharacterized protein LOC121100782 isoform X2 [Ursus maritimus]